MIKEIYNKAVIIFLFLGTNLWLTEKFKAAEAIDSHFILKEGGFIVVMIGLSFLMSWFLVKVIKIKIKE